MAERVTVADLSTCCPHETQAVSEIYVFLAEIAHSVRVA